MYYTIMLLTDEGWCQGSDIVTNSQSVLNMVYGVFSHIDDDKGRVVVGTTYRTIQKALKVQAEGGVSASMTFGQVRNREMLNAHMLKSVEQEYDASDNDQPYLYTSPQNVSEMLRWLELRQKFLARRLGDKDDGDDTLRVRVV